MLYLSDDLSAYSTRSDVVVIVTEKNFSSFLLKIKNMSDYNSFT